ncbi:hypothetical protein SAEN8230_21450 [Salmonella enterica subsp. arizonae]
MADVPGFILHHHRQRVAAVTPRRCRRKAPLPPAFGQRYLFTLAIMRYLHHHPARIDINITEDKAWLFRVGEIIASNTTVILMVQCNGRRCQRGINGKFQHPRDGVACLVGRLHLQGVFPILHVIWPGIIPDPCRALRCLNPCRATVDAQAYRIHIFRHRYTELRVDVIGHIIANDAAVINQLNLTN